MKTNQTKEKEEYIKSEIFYARTYRHLTANHKMIGIYYLFFVIPCSALYLFNYSGLTLAVSEWSVKIINLIINEPELGIGISKIEFLPYFGDIHHVSLQGKLPSVNIVLINFAVIAILLMACYFMKDYAKPLAVYLTIALLIHLISSAFFLLFKDKFPYTLTDYSGLYMVQQVGIWLSFFMIATLISGVLNNSGVSKFVMIGALMTYSFVFGVIRYIVFMVIMFKFSSLYMAILFFTFGPLWDFLYLVGIYSIYMSRLTEKYDDKDRGMKWEWA